MSAILIQDEWRRAATRYITECRMAARDVFPTQMRLALKRIMSFTPPKTLAQGRFAILGDLLGGRSIGGASGVQKSRGIFMQHDGEPMRVSENTVALFYGKDGRIWGSEKEQYRPNASIREMRGHHNAYRSPLTGKVTKAGSWDRTIGRWKFVDRMVVGKSAMRRYLAHIWKRVGWTKSGWVPAYHHVGGKAPGWITRHASRPGYTVDDLKDTNFPSIEATNIARRVNQGGEMDRVIRSALDVRVRSMAKDLTRRHKEAAQKAGLA